MNDNTRNSIKKIIEQVITYKLSHYNPETAYMPFHYRLLGKDKMAMFSFIHSINTTFGVSIFEPIAAEIAINNFKKVEKQYHLKNQISENCLKEIQLIINELSINGNPNKNNEIERIRKYSRQGKPLKYKTVRVDLFLQDKNDNIYLIDIKTAKPNISNFKDFKRTLLEWIGLYLYSKPEAKVQSILCIPYNPYHPKPYERWTIKGMLDTNSELLIDKEFWDFLGGENTFEELLDLFEIIGEEIKPKLDDYFNKIK